MAGLRIINIKTGEDSAVNGGGSGGGQIPANVVTRDDIFDSNGKIRADIIDVSIDGQSLSLKEDSSNKVTTIDSSSTHTQYPSAKAVYDVLTSAIGSIDVSIDPASLEGKEDSSNKVTVIDSSSTDEQYPSAKAVYDALVESKNVIFCSESEFWGLDPDESTLYITKETLTPTFGGYAISPLIQYRDGKNTFSEKYFNYEKFLELEATAESEGWSDKEWEDAFNNITLDYENVDFDKYGKVEGSYYLSFSEGGGHGFDIQTDGEYCWWSGLGTYDFYFNILNNRTGSTLSWNDGNSTVETPNVLYAHARIDGKKHGLLLFPDNFNIWYNGDNNLIVNFLRLPNGAEYKNEITREELINLLIQGCEFIPAMGYSNANNSYTNVDSELCLLTGSYYTASGKPVVFDWDCNQKDISYNGVAKDKDSFRTISKFFSKYAIKVIYNLYLGRKLVFSTHKDDENSSENSSETGDKIVCLTRTEYNTLVENEEIDPDKFYVVEDKGASFGGLVIAPTQLTYDGNKFYIPEFGEDVDTGSGEELPPIEIEPPLTSSGSTSLYDYACINSAGSKYGKTAGSTYFTPQTDLINELVNPNAQTDDGFFIPISSLGYDDWKIMTGDDFRKIFDPESRPGATVNGNENCLYAFVYASEGGWVEPLSASDPNAGNNEARFGVLIFPDGVTIEGATLDNFNYNNNNADNSGEAYAVNGNAQFATWISPEDINDYISQGCVFIPMLGSAYSADNEISWDDSWAPILTSNGIYDFNEYGFNINGTSDSWEEYIPIRLVSKKAVEGATTYTVYKNGGIVVDTNDRKELKNKVNYVEMTQLEFVNLKNKDPKTLYVVTGATAEETAIESESMPSFGGIAIAPTQLFYDGENFHIGAPAPETIDPGDVPVVNSDNDGYFGWDLNSYDSVYGLESGSTYFSYDELVKTFDSEGDPEVPIDNGGLKLSYNGFDDWRMMTYEDVQKLFNPELREGSTVNGAQNVLYAIVKVNDNGDQGTASSFRGGDNFGIGVLLFPDGMTINGVSVDNATNVFPINDYIGNISDSATYWEIYINGDNGIPELTTDEINEYTSQGCVFLPSLGAYEERTTGDYANWWGNEDEYNLCFAAYYYAGHLDSSAESHVADNINPTREWFCVRIDENDSSPLVSFAFCDSSTYSEYGEQDHNVYIPVRLVSTSAAQSGSKSVPKTSVYLGDILITGESVTESGFVFVTRAEYEALGSNINPNKFYVVEDGAAGGDTTAKFGDIEVAPTQLMWSEDRGGFFIPTLDEALEIANSGGSSEPPTRDAEPTPEDLELWNNLYMYSVINSNGEYVGREEHSTYFSYNELGQFFSSAGDSFDGESDIDNKGGKVTFNGKSWRLPTKEEMRALFDSTKRTGATVDGISNACWAPAHISFTSGDDDPIVASEMFEGNEHIVIVVFPDDVEIDAASMNIEFNKINPTEEESRYEPQPKGYEVYTELNSIQLGYLLSKGCLILPMLGFYQENSGDGGLYNAEGVPDGWWASIMDGKGLYMTATKDYCYYINGSTDIYDDDAYAYFGNNGWDTTPVWGTVRLVTEAAGNQSYKVYKNGQLIFDSNNASGSGSGASSEEVSEIRAEMKNKIEGEILTPEDYNYRCSAGEIDPNKIYFVEYPSFDGFYISGNPLELYGGNLVIGNREWYHVLRDDAEIYFNFLDLAEHFDSEGSEYENIEYIRPIDNGGMPYVSGGVGEITDFRMPTDYEIRRIFSNNRTGSTVNGVPNICYLPIHVDTTSVEDADRGDYFGILLFPDNRTITGAELNIERANIGCFSTTNETVSSNGNLLTLDELNVYEYQGCVFIPALGYYSTNYNDVANCGDSISLYTTGVIVNDHTNDRRGIDTFVYGGGDGQGFGYTTDYNNIQYAIYNFNDPISELRPVFVVSSCAQKKRIFKGYEELTKESPILDVCESEDFNGEYDDDKIYVIKTGGYLSFGGLTMSPGPLMYDSSDGFIISDDPFANSYSSSSYGKVQGSTLFSYDELKDFDVVESNGTVWRLLTEDDFFNHFVTTNREGATIINKDGKFEHICYAVIYYKRPGATKNNAIDSALIIYPDGLTIHQATLPNGCNSYNMSSSISQLTSDEIEVLFNAGCLILPATPTYKPSENPNWSWSTGNSTSSNNGFYVIPWKLIRISANSNNMIETIDAYILGSHKEYSTVRLVTDVNVEKSAVIYKRRVIGGEPSRTISSNSTEYEYASSKAVYDYVNDKLSDIENLLSQI